MNALPSVALTLEQKEWLSRGGAGARPRRPPMTGVAVLLFTMGLHAVEARRADGVVIDPHVAGSLVRGVVLVTHAHLDQGRDLGLRDGRELRAAHVECD